MTGKTDRSRLEKLDAQIAKAKAKGDPAAPQHEDHHSQAHLAWRMVIELVAGLAIGFGIGFGLDALFGTRPLFLVLFILLGFAAGVRTMLRTANEVGGQGVAGEAGTNTPPDGRNG